MARPRMTPRTLRHCCSSPRNCWRCVADNARLLPVVFILVLLTYAYLILTFSIAISYTLLHRRRLFAALVQLVLTHALLGGAALALLITVFRGPGTPVSKAAGGLDGLEEGRAGTGLSAAGEHSAVDGDIGNHDGDGWRPTGAEAAQEYRDEGEGDGDHAPLLPLASPSSTRGARSQAHTAPLLTSGPTSLIPGQPRLPARTDRDQLADQLSLAARLAPPSSSARIDPASASTRLSTSSSSPPSGPLSGPAPRRSRSDSTSKMSELMVKSTGEARWCNKCSGPKPDRAHHCSTCGVCVLRMDHHCPWLGGCVGLRNHKAFFLFLSYTSLACVYAAQESARGLIRWINEETNGSETTPITWAILLLIGFIFGLALVPFAGYHAFLICSNKTTIESMEGGGRVRVPSERLRGDRRARPSVQDRLRQIVGNSSGGPPPRQPTPREAEAGGSGGEVGLRWREDQELTRQERKALKKANQLNVYNIGWRRNWRIMMGQHWWEWFLPWGEPDTDGFSYDVNQRALKELDRITYRIRTGQEPPPDQGYHRQSGSEDEEEDEDVSRRVLGGVRSDDAGPDGLIRVHDEHPQERSPANRMTFSEQRRAAAHGRVPLPQDGREGGPQATSWESGHGESEWGPAPRRDFVLYDVDSDEDT